MYARIDILRELGREPWPIRSSCPDPDCRICNAAVAAYNHAARRRARQAY